MVLRNWERLANRSGIDSERLIDRVRDLATHLPDAIDTVFRALPQGAEPADLRRRFLSNLTPQLDRAVAGFTASERGSTP